MKEKTFLPIGSIISLKEGKRKIMIIGINQLAKENNKKYDYVAVLYPYGYLNSQELLLFNNDKIDKIYYKGYEDEEMINFYEDVIWSISIEKGDK